MKFAAFQNPAIFELFNKIFNASLPVKVAYRLSKLQKVMSEEAEKYQKLRMAVVNTYGAKDENGELVVDENGNVKLEGESMDKLVAEMNDLHDIEFEVPSKIKLDDIETIELTAFDLSVLAELEMLEE